MDFSLNISKASDQSDSCPLSQWDLQIPPRRVCGAHPIWLCGSNCDQISPANSVRNAARIPSAPVPRDRAFRPIRHRALRGDGSPHEATPRWRRRSRHAPARRWSSRDSGTAQTGARESSGARLRAAAGGGRRPRAIIAGRRRASRWKAWVPAGAPGPVGRACSRAAARGPRHPPSASPPALRTRSASGSMPAGPGSA